MRQWKSLAVLALNGAVFVSAQTVDIVGPNWTTINGSTSVTIMGTGFISGTTVCDIDYSSFGSPAISSKGGPERPAASGLAQVSFPCTVVDGNRITGTVPGHNALFDFGTLTVRNALTGGATSAFRTRAAGTTTPSLTGLSVSSKVFGSGQFTLGLTGTGFDSTAQVFFVRPGASPQQISPVTVNSATSLTVAFPASLMQQIANGYIYVVTNIGVSFSIPVSTQLRPFNVVAPSISSLAPPTISAGSGNTTLTLNGSFPGSGAGALATQVRFTAPGGSPQNLTPVTSSETVVTVLVPSALLTTPGNAAVQFSIPFTTTVNSNTATLPITQPPPVISGVTPPSVARGSATTNFSLSGSNFTPGSQAVTFTPPGGSATSVTIQAPPTPTASTMTVSVPNALLTVVGTGTFVVTTSAGGASNGATITIVQPVISSVNPTSLLKGSVNPSLTVGGTNFTIGGSPVLEFTPPGGSATNITPSSSSATTLVATIPSGLLTASGDASLRVISGTASSSSVTLPINAPAITSLTPNTAPQNSASTNVTIAGTGFTLGGTPTATWIGPGGSPTTSLTVVGSPTATSMVVTVLNSLLTTAGTAQIFVTTGTATSNSSPFTITAAGPSLTSSNPTNLAQNTATTVTLSGSNLSPLTSITFTPPGGSAQTLTPSSASATSITVSLNAGQLANTGNGVFTATTSVSPAATLTVPVAAPSITLTSPATVLKGATSATVTLSGIFNVGGNTGVGRWISPSPGPTTDFALSFPTAGVATFVVGAPELANAGSATVRVVAGGALSNAVTIPVIEPVITSLNPNSAQQNAATLNVILNGSNLTAGGSPVVRFTPPGGSPTSLNLVGSPNATAITATVPNTLLGTAGIATITLQTGSAISAPVNFTITAGGPVLTSVTPSTTPQNTAATFTLNGSNLSPLSSLTFTPQGGAAIPLTPSSASATTIVVALTAGQLGTLGTGVFTATTAVSPAATVNIQVTAPVLTSINPVSVVKGGTTQTFTVNGNFFGATIARFTAPVTGTVTDHPLVAVSAGIATFTVGTAQLQNAGTATVRIVEGGSSSSTLDVAILEPVITSLNPTSTLQNAPTFNLILSGTNFTAGGTPVVRFTPPGGVATVLSLNPTPTATSISAILPTSLLGTTGLATVTVQTGTALSAGVNFSIGSGPAITSLSQTLAVAGGAQISPLVITGVNFNAAGPPTAFFVAPGGSPVALTNTVIPTDTSMSVTIPAGLLLNPGSATVFVRTGTTDSPNANFTIAPAPTLDFVSPNVDFAGAPDIQIGLSGLNFISGGTPTVRWTSGNTITTLAIVGTPAATSLVATVPAALLATPGSASITVLAGGVSSTPVTFTILPTPVISLLSPASVPAGGAAFTLTITGANLDQPGYTPSVRFNTTNLNPLSASATTIAVSVPPQHSAAAGVFPVTVTLNQISFAASKGLPGASRVLGEVRNVSNPLNFTVTGAAPALTSLNPPSATSATSSAFALTIVGSGFAAGDTIDFAGTSITPSSITNTQLVATVPASAIATPGVKNVRVLTSAGAPSNTLPFRSNYNIRSLSPPFATAGGAQFTLTLDAFAVLPGAQIVFNGTPLTTTSSTATSVTANVPASLITTVSDVPVTLTDGTLTSNQLAFFILGPVSITSLNPSFVQAGSPTFTLQVNGTGFDSGSTVLANGNPLSGTAGTATQITATIPASLVQNPGSLSITVRDSNQRTSNAVALPILGALTVTTLNPSFAAAGSANLPITVTGTLFDNGSVVLANGSPVTSAFVSETQMTATVPASLLASPGSVSIGVRDSRNRTSNTVALPVLGGLSITSLSPTFREAGTAAFTLTVNGTAFDEVSVVLAGSTTLATSFVSATQLQATVPAEPIASAGSLAITVRDARSRTSNAFSLPILAPIRITTMTPNFRDAGSGAFTISIGGLGFESISVINFNGTPLQAQVVVPFIVLNGAVPANLIASAGTATVTVTDNRGRTSNSVPFHVLTPLTLTSLSPSFVEAGAAAFTLTLNGTGFTNGMNVLFGGNSIPVSVTTSTQATVQIQAGLVGTAGTIPVSVTSQVAPAFEGGPVTRQSNTLNFLVATPLSLTNVNPTRANAGVQAFPLTVSGQGFASGAVIRFNNANLTTTFVNSTTLTGIVTSALVGAPGTTEVRVQLQDGRISTPLPFTILPQLRLTQISPSAVAAGANSFTLTLTGEGFTNESIVRIGGLSVQTTFVSATQLTAFVNDSFVANPTTLEVTVANPLGAVSNALSFGAGGTITVTSVNPPAAPAGSNSLTIVVSGTGFTNGTVVRFGSTDLSTTFVSATQLNALIPAQLLTNPGNFAITAAAGATVSNAVNFEVGGKPELNFLNPDAVTAGSRTFTLIALGRGFLPGATIKFGDDEISATFVSGTQVSGVISAALIATARTVQVTVVNPNGAASNSKEFRIGALTLTSLTPDKATAGGPAISLAVEGTGFINGAIIGFGGRSLITSFGGATRLSAQIPADALVNAGRINVTVSNPDGAVSNALPFTVESDTPTISRINPSSVVAGSGEVTIAVTGGGFVRGSSVTANGNGLATTFNSATSLDAVIPADLVLNIRNLVIKVVNPGNKESNEVGLSVTAPSPAITSITPPSINAGTTVDVAITIAGSGFIQGSSVSFNGSGIETSFNSATSLSAVIPASALTTAGNALVQVVNPGDLRSNTVPFNILGAVTVTSVNPATLSAGGASDPVVTVAGTGFVNGSTVLFGGAALPTTFGSATSLTATVPQNLLTTARTVSVSVRNPNGAVSNGVNLTVTPPVPPLTLNVPATINAAGNGVVQVLLGAPAPVALQGTLTLSFVSNANGTPAGYVDPALAFAGAAAGSPRVIAFTIAQGVTTAVIPGNGAFSPGTVAGTITITLTGLNGAGQNLLPSPSPSRDIVVERAVPSTVTGSVRITNAAGGFQVELNGISSPRDLRTITYTFTASGTSILEGASVTVDVSALFTAYFASDAGRAAGGTFRFTMPFTVSGGDAAAVTAVSVTMTNSVGTSTAVSGGR